MISSILHYIFLLSYPTGRVIFYILTTYKNGGLNTIAVGMFILTKMIMTGMLWEGCEYRGTIIFLLKIFSLLYTPWLLTRGWVIFVDGMVNIVGLKERFKAIFRDQNLSFEEHLTAYAPNGYDLGLRHANGRFTID